VKSSAQANERELTMTDGRTTAGTIIPNGGTYRALSSDGIWLGTFTTLKEAAREISRSRAGQGR
jgi:hypothetical protein